MYMLFIPHIRIEAHFYKDFTAVRKKTNDDHIVIPQSSIGDEVIKTNEVLFFNEIGQNN